MNREFTIEIQIRLGAVAKTSERNLRKTSILASWPFGEKTARDRQKL